MTSVPCQVDVETPLEKLFEEYCWGDLWAEGNFVEVIRYLRGSKKLVLPEHWRRLIPKVLVDAPMED